MGWAREVSSFKDLFDSLVFCRAGLEEAKLPGNCLQWEKQAKHR